MANLPYVGVTGTLESMLGKIRAASVPDKFSQDFVSNTLSMKGGSARAIIPFIKKMGFVSSEGVPTDRYREFRNPSKSGQAVAEAMCELYSTLFDMNERVYKLDNTKLRNLIVEATGAEASSSAVKKTLSTFNALKALATFETPGVTVESTNNIKHDEVNDSSSNGPLKTYSGEVPNSNTVEGINLSYTINLNLPATTDIEIFNAIFKSLKEHMLQG